LRSDPVQFSSTSPPQQAKNSTDPVGWANKGGEVVEKISLACSLQQCRPTSFPRLHVSRLSRETFGWKRHQNAQGDRVEIAAERLLRGMGIFRDFSDFLIDYSQNLVTLRGDCVDGSY
jgi:hypothetical protein